VANGADADANDDEVLSSEAVMMRSRPEHRCIAEEEEEDDTGPHPGSTIVLDPQNKIYLHADPEPPPVLDKTRAKQNKSPKRKMDYLKVNMTPRIRELSFDIIGPGKDSPFPWQRNIAVQVDIAEGSEDGSESESEHRGRSQRSCSESAVRGILSPIVRPKCMRKGLSLDSANTKYQSMPQRVRSLREEEGVHLPSPRPVEGLASPPERKRRTAMTEGTVSMYDLLALANSAHKPKR
jgi:hypothetical protein